MKRARSRLTLRVESLVVLVALYCVAFGNGSWWAALSSGRSLEAPATWLFLGACFTALVAVHFLVLALPASRWTVRPWLTLVVIATSFAAYYMSTYHVLLDPTMLRNVLRTDRHEATELLSVSMAVHVLLWAAVPVAFIWWVRLDQRPWLPSAAFRAAALGLSLVVAVVALLPINRDFTSLMRNQRGLRYLVTPGNLLYSLSRNAVADVRVAGEPKAVIGADATRIASTGKHRVFVFVLGETARARNFSLSGYGRPTTPRLAQLDIVPFTNVRSCGTSTEISVPCMFSPFGRADYDETRIRSSEGLLHVLGRAGFALRWVDNQSGCKGVCDVPGLAYRKPALADAPDLCDEDECLDEVLVRALRQELSRVTGDTVIVLHQMGNHGPAYYRRYPPAYRRFTPDCATAELRLCSEQEVVNAYDNALLYTDHVLAELIGVLAAQQEAIEPALLYVSDHGESLGEAGLYLHGVPYAIAPDVQTHVPLVVWLSRPFADSGNVDLVCLNGRRQQAYSHDNLFDSVLGLLDVATSLYRPERDLFAPCRGGGSRLMHVDGPGS